MEIKEYKKYRLLKDQTMSIVIDNSSITLYRIQAIKDFGTIKSGTIGGFVQSERNLSHYGNCWIYDDAYAYMGSKITNNGKLFNHAQAKGKCRITKNAIVKGYSIIEGLSHITDDVILGGCVKVVGTSIVSGSGVLSGTIIINDSMKLKE